MKALLQVSDRLTIEVEAESQKALFSGIADAQEIFGEEKCGKCSNTDLQYRVRDVDGNQYYEIKCKNLSCNARFKFGLHKTGGTLFPKKKEDGEWLPDGGWMKWNKETQSEE